MKYIKIITTIVVSLILNGCTFDVNVRPGYYYSYGYHPCAQQVIILR